MLFRSQTLFGRAYQGDRIAFGYIGSSAYAEHAAIHGKLRGAVALKVFYNPSHPEESVLSTGSNWSTLRMILFGLLILSFVAVFVAFWKMGSGEDGALVDSIVVLEMEAETPGQIEER